MKGAIGDPAALDTLPHVREWLGYSKAAVDIVSELGAGLSDDERMAMLLQQNVILQLNHLKTHPTVATKLAKKEVTLHGWVYDIKTGGIVAYDEKDDAFEPVSERYSEEVAKLAAEMTNCSD